VDSGWTTLLPGFLVAGVGIGLVNAPLASTSVSVVEPQRAGMASGINNTFRQIGIATGIAALGAIFQSRITSHIAASRLPRQVVHPFAQAVSSGATQQALQIVPAPFRSDAKTLADSDFISGLNGILVVAAVVLFAGAVLAFALVRQRDFVASSAPVAVEADYAAGAARAGRGRKRSASCQAAIRRITAAPVTMTSACAAIEKATAFAVP